MSTSEVCIACGEPLEDGMRFCTSCGAPVEDDATAPVPEAAEVVIRRNTTRRSPLLPPSEHDDEDADVVVARNWAMVARKRTAPNQVGKSRKIAGDLPAWDPLPPGETVVTRRSRTSGAK